MNLRITSKPLRKAPSRRRFLQALGFACLAATAALPARAQTPYVWDGGTGNWSDPTQWTPMTVPNSVNADVAIDGGKTGVNSVVTMDNSYTVGRLTVDAGDTLNTNNGTTLTVSTGGFAGSGSIIDNGTINLTGGYYNTQLIFNGPGSLSGTGTLNLGGGGNNLYLYESNSGDLLTVGAGFTVAGAGNVGNGQTTFSNLGTISANTSGAVLDLQPGGGNATFANGSAGIAQATGGGILQLNGNNGGVFSGGTFRALADSQVNIVDGATVSGATLATAGTGTVNNLNTATLNNVTNNGIFNTNNSRQHALSRHADQQRHVQPRQRRLYGTTCAHRPGNPGRHRHAQAKLPAAIPRLRRQLRRPAHHQLRARPSRAPATWASADHLHQQRPRSTPTPAA